VIYFVKMLPFVIVQWVTWVSCLLSHVG